jgi:hypothetical protein
MGLTPRKAPHLQAPVALQVAAQQQGQRAGVGVDLLAGDEARALVRHCGRGCSWRAAR